MQPNPRLYLDVDGVIIADKSPFETTPLNHIESYAPEVVRRLGNTGLELVWLTTWENEALLLAEQMGYLTNGRVLRLGFLGATAIDNKANSLLNDQFHSPAPFVWVDDRLNNDIQTVVSAKVRVPHLFIRPNYQTGLEESHLVQIETFASEHISRN